MIYNEKESDQQIQEEVVTQDQGIIDTPQTDLVSTREKQESLSTQSSPASPINNANYELRKKSERLEQERDEMMRRLQALEAKSNTSQPVEEEDYSINLGESDLAEGRHLTKLQKQMRKQQEELSKANAQMQSLLVETRLKSEHPDIDRIVTSDNLKSLSELYPEVAQMLNSSTDYYSKAKSAYTMIKKFGIHIEDTFGPERELAQRNAAKPRPLASVSPQQAESPLSRANAFANGLTEDLKKQLYREMEDSIKNG